MGYGSKLLRFFGMAISFTGCNQSAISAEDTFAFRFYSMNRDGTHLALVQEISGTPGSGPAVSPFNSLIAFSVGQVGSTARRIDLIASDGTARRSVTSQGDDVTPAFSPDGRIILFYRYAPKLGLYSLDWGEPVWISSEGLNVQVSSDGKQIVYLASETNGSNSIYVMDRDGGNKRKVLTSISTLIAPSFNPKGNTRILFTKAPRTANERSGVYSINIDATGEVLLSETAPNPREARFSPDATQIVFSAADPSDGTYQIYAIDSTGSNPHRLTTLTDFWAVSPSFTSDGLRIVFLAIPRKSN